MMTVKQLREELSKFDDDCEVGVETSLKLNPDDPTDDETDDLGGKTINGIYDSSDSFRDNHKLVLLQIHYNMSATPRWAGKTDVDQEQ